MRNFENPPSRDHILLMTGIIEGGMAVVALAAAQLLGIRLVGDPDRALTGAITGIAASLPMIAGFLLLHFLPVRAMGETFDAFSNVLKPFLTKCTAADVIAIAGIAALGEEMFFRGLIQALISDRFGLLPGLMASGLLFGVLHAMTPLYAVIATAAGFYLGWLFHATGSLWTPIMTHGFYDAVLLLYFLRRWKVE